MLEERKWIMINAIKQKVYFALQIILYTKHTKPKVNVILNDYIINLKLIKLNKIFLI